MQLFFWIWMVLLLKLPIAFVCWFVYKAIKETPDQVIGEGDGGAGVRFTQGPRKRGPEDGTWPWQRGPRRGDLGHEEAEREPTPKPVMEHVRRRE